MMSRDDDIHRGVAPTESRIRELVPVCDFPVYVDALLAAQVHTSARLYTVGMQIGQEVNRDW